MYDKVIDAITKRANHNGYAYVEDYGSSIHKVAKISFDDTLEVIENLERLGWATVTRTTSGFPIAVKLLKNPRDCKEIIGRLRYSMISNLKLLRASYTDIAVSEQRAYNQ